MENIEITSVSSRGQVVIPQEMRGDLKEGDKLVIIKNDGQIILRKADKFSETLEEDLEFAKRTEEAYKRYERGEFKEMEFDDFIKEMKKWWKFFQSFGSYEPSWDEEMVRFFVGGL